MTSISHLADRPDESLAGKAADRVLWLATVTATGRPTIRPVWFVHLSGTVAVFSAPTAAKVHHVQTNPQVVLTFHTDPDAQHVHVVSGRAEVTLDGPPPSTIRDYLRKYEALYPAVGFNRASFDATFSARITITPTRSWGW